MRQVRSSLLPRPSGFRHSHLDSGGYSFDQKEKGKDLSKAVDFLVKDEQGRVLLTSMVACLFARGVYTDELLARCLKSVGYGFACGEPRACFPEHSAAPLEDPSCQRFQAGGRDDTGAIL